MIFNLDLKGVDPAKLVNEGFHYTAKDGSIEIHIHIQPLGTNIESSLSPPDAHGRSADTALSKSYPDAESIKFATKTFPTVDIPQQVLLFRDYYQDKLRTNWRGAWKSWCDRAQNDYRNNKKETRYDPTADPYADAAKALRLRECDPE